VADRFAVIGLARSREAWFAELTRWADAAVAPIDFVKCLSSDEARAVLATGRPVSALLIDAGLPRFDRDLVTHARAFDTAVVLIGRHDSLDPEALGCAARLDPDFTRDDLVEILGRVARTVGPDDVRSPGRLDLDDAGRLGRLTGVLGSGGSGVSTVAMWLAQASADSGADTVLVDGCRRADLAMYHDIGDVYPGLPELLELHRSQDADPDDVRALEFPTERGYRLLLGLRRPRDWAGHRPAATAAAIAALRRTHEVTIVDIDADTETERETGSADVEDRHATTLAVVRSADSLVVVTRPGLKGVRDAARVFDDLIRTGVAPERVVIVVNDAPRGFPVKARVIRSLRSLTAPSAPGAVTFVRSRRDLASHHETADRLPSKVGAALLREVEATAGAGVTHVAEPQRVRIGELGSSVTVMSGATHR